MPKNPHSSFASARTAAGAKKRPTKAAKTGIEVLEGRIAPASAFSSAVLSLNPAAYYQLGEASGSAAADSSGNNLTGTYFGSPLYGQTGAPQVTDTTAIGFTGSSYVNVPLSISADFTIAGWVKTTQTAGSGNWYNGVGLIDGEVGGVTNDFGTALLNGGKFAFGVGNADTTVVSSQSINDGGWHFIVATRNATSGLMQVYVDGALGGSLTGPTGVKASPPVIRIGGMQTGVSSFVGTMDDVALFTTELTAAQISNLYSAAAVTTTTDIGISGTDLLITDANGGNSNDNLQLKIVGGALQITDLDGAILNVTGIGGSTGSGTSTVTIPLNAWSGTIQLNTLAGNDAVTLDLSGGDFIYSGVTFNGGDPTVGPGDKLTILGGAQGTVTYDYQNAHDGSIAMSNFGTVTYTGLEPITNTGSATDIVFNLPKLSPNVATLTNFGTSSDGLSTLSGATFESTTFANPSGSVTINRGTPADTLNVGTLPDFTASLAIGTAATPFDGITFAGAFTLAVDNNLTAHALSDIVLSTAASDLAVQGAGSVSLAAGRSIGINTDASIAVANGSLTLTANAAGTGSGNFVGIDLNGALSSTGAGSISLVGTGGNTGASNHGIYLGRLSTASITSSGGGIVTLTGTGGLGAGGDNDGIIVERSSAISSNGNLILVGTVGAAGAGQNEGLNFDAGDTVTATGAANITFITDQGFLLRNATINAGTNTVTLRQKTAGTPINVGTYAFNIAGISEQTLDSITAGTVQIGDVNSGAITVSSAISHGNNFSLTTGAGVTVNAPIAMAADKNLTITAQGTATGTINLANANADLTATGTGAISLTTARDIVVNGANITTVNGNLTLSGNVAGTGTGAFSGIILSSNATVGSSGTGQVSLTGRGGVGPSGTNVLAGIQVLYGSTVTGGTTGTLNVTGFGGATPNGHSHFGVLVAYQNGGLPSNITSSGANVAITGTGGGTGTAFNSVGVMIYDGGAFISSGPGANVTIHGTGSAASAADNHGFALNTGSLGVSVRSGGGNISITGVAGNASSQGIRWYNAADSVTTAANGGNITLIANSMVIGGAVSTNASGTVTLRPATNGTLINLGSAGGPTGGTLELSDAELDFVTAGTVQIGDANSGAITVSAAMTHLNANALSLTAGTGQNINLNGSLTTAGGSITFGNAVVVAGTSALDTSNAGAVPAGAAINVPSSVNLGANLLNLNAGATNYAINGVISGNGGQLTKLGTGTLTVSNANTYTGATAVNGGVLSVNGTLASSSVSVASAATLNGTGVIAGTVSVSSAGTIAPGLSAGIIATGALSLASGSNYSVEINSPIPGTGYDQTNVTGTVSLSGANLVIAPASAITSSPGQQIVLIKNDGTDAITGTFNGLAEGATLSVNGTTFRISYAGGAGGNDVTLTETGAVSYSSDGTGGGALELRVSGSNLQFLDDGVIVDARPVANLTNQAFTVTGANGQNETLFVNYGAGGFFDVDVAWNGGIGAADNDALRVGGGTFTTVTHTFTAGGPEHSGNIVYNTAAAAQSTITYTGLEPIDMSGSTISDLVFNSLGGNAVLEDDGTLGNNISQVRSIGGLFETTTFSTPTGSLTFNMGADSATFTVSSPDSLFNSSLTINGEGGTDSIVVNSALVLGSATSNGHLTLTAEAISLNASARTDNSTTGTHGNVQLNGAVTLGANVTIDTDGTGSDGTVAFSSTINGDLANTRTLTITAGAGALSFGGAIGNTASLNALSTTSGGALALPATTIGAGALNVTATGVLTQTGGIVVGGTATFAAGAGNDITLTNPANNFSTVAITSGNNVSITDANALNLGASTVSGTLGVATTGAITQSGALSVAGTATFAAGAGNDITLTNPANNFSTVAITSGNNVSVTDANALSLGASTISGTFGVIATGAITQSGALSVTGTSSFNAGAGVITLNNASNNFTGAASLANTGANAVAITDINGLILGTVTIGSGAFDVTAVGITQTGTVTQAAGAGVVTLTGGNGSIVLGAANDFTGIVNATISGTNDITINDAAGNLRIGLISAPNRTVTLSSTAGEITDENAGNNVAAQTLNLSATSGIGISGANGALDSTVTFLKALTATGGIAIDNTGALTISDTGAFATPGGARVTGASGGISIRALSPLTVAANVTSPGAILLVASESAAAGDNLTVNSGVLVQSTGSSVTLQAGDNIALVGGISPQISAATAVTLNAANADADNSGGITVNGGITAGGLVSLTARDTISLGANVASTGGNLTYTSTVGAVTRTAGTSSGNVLTASAASGITLTTDVATLNLTNTTSGNISVSEANDVNVALAVTQAGNGSITIGAGGNIQLTGLVAANGSGAIDLLAQGELTLNDVVGGDDVVSGTGNIALRANAGVHINNARVTTAGDGLIDADANLAANTGPIDMTAAGLITVNNLVANAAQGITLWTSVNTLTATNTFSNAITINEVSGVALNQVSNPGRDVFITLGAGAITDNNGASQNVIGARSRLVAPGGIGTSGDALETTLANFEASTSGGLFVGEADALTIGGVTAANGITANASAVTISSGSLTLDEDVSTSGIVTFNSSGFVLETTGGVKNATRLNVNSATGQQLVGANTVASFDSTNTASGDVTLLNTTGTLTVIRIANLVGNATVSNSNNVQLGDSSGQNINISGIATIIASAGAITDGHAPTPDDGTPVNNITASGAVLTSSGTIGTATNAIETAITRLEAASSASGGVFITEADALIVGGLAPLVNGVSATTGNIRINSGSLDIQERIGTAGNVTLNSTGSIIESGAGFVSASLLTTVSNGGQVLGGANTVDTFTATNTGAGSGILLENNAAGFVISTVTSQTGGNIYINNAGNGATISGLVRSGNPVLGGDITIQTNGLLTVNAVVDSRGGSGGTLTLGGQINVNTSPIVGFGNVTLQGGPGTLNIFAPITVSSPLVLQSTVDVNILAKVETTSVLADITVLADMDGDGLGGVYLGQGGGSNQGQLKAGRNLDVRGSEYQGTAPGAAALANLDNSVVIQPNGSTARLEAVGNILVKNNGSAPFDAQIWLGGLVRSNTNGDVAFDNAVLVTSSSARVQSHSDGDVIFVGTVDSATGGTAPYDLGISAGNGVVLFNAAVGAVNPLANVSIDSALDVTVTSTFAAQSLVITDATGTVEFGGAVTTTGTGTNLSVNAVNLLINGAINATAPGAALGNILLQANNLTIGNNVAGDGTLTIQPRDVDRSIGLNEVGDLNLDSSELDRIQNGFAQILIGRADGAGLLSIGARAGLSAWQDPVVFRSSATGGEIALLGETAGTDDSSFTFLAPNITVDVPTSPAISTAGGFVQIGLFTATAATVLESDLEIQTAGGAVNIIGTINGASDLIINAGTGDVYLNGNMTPVPTGTSIGGEVPLNSISVTGDLVTLRPNMRSEGAQTYTGTSIHLLGGDFRTFGDGTGAVVFNGAVVLEGVITVTTTNSDIEFNGSVDNIALHTTTAGKGALRLTAENGNILFGGDVGTTFAPRTIQVVSATLVELGDDLADTFKGGASVTIVAEELDLAGDVSVPGGVLSITNKLDGQGILIGGTESGSAELQLSDSDIAALGDGTASIVIGRRAGSGTADLVIAESATFQDPVIFQQPSKTAGSIVVGADLVGIGNAGFTFNGPATRLNADIITAGGAVDIENAVGEAALSTIDTSAGGGAVTFRGTLKGLAGGEDISVNAGAGTIWLNTSSTTPLTGTLLGTLTLTNTGLTRIERGLTAGALVVDGGGTVALKGSITTTEAGGQDYDDAVRLIGGVNLTSRHADGVIHFGNTIDSDPAQPTRKHNLSVTNRSLSPSGTTVQFDGAVGSLQTLGNLKVTTTGDIVFGPAANIVATGLSLRGDAFTVQDVTTTGAQVYYGAGTFDGAINALKLTVTSTTDIVNSGGAWVVAQLASLTAKNSDISITGAGNSFGELVLRGVNATVEEAGNMLLRSTSLTGVLDLTATATAEAGDISQSTARVTAFRLEVDAAGAVNFTRPDTRLTQVGDMTSGADLTLLVRGARYVLLDGVISAIGDVLLAANPYGKGSSFSTGGSNVTINAGGRWVVYSTYAEYPTDGTDLIAQLGPDFSISGESHPFAAPAGQNVLVFQQVMA